VSCGATAAEKGKNEGGGRGATEKNIIRYTRALCDFKISTILHVLLLQMV
jgi:hypothetical protein